MLIAALPTQAEGDELPFYGSLRADEVNVRKGPGTRYPISWVFKKEGYPVKVLTQHLNWYQIRDPEGEEGWVYKNFVSRRHNVIIDGDSPAPMTKDIEGQKPLARLEPGVIGALEKCVSAHCLVTAGHVKGWVHRQHLGMLGDNPPTN